VAGNRLVESGVRQRPSGCVWTVAWLALAAAALAVITFWLLSRWGAASVTAVSPRELTIPSAEFLPISAFNAIYTDHPFALTGSQVVFVGRRDPAARLMLASLDVTTGEQVWQGEGESWGTVAGGNGRVYVEDTAGLGSRLTAYEGFSGNELWQRRFRMRVESVTISGGGVAVRTYVPVHASFRRRFTAFHLLEPETGATMQRQGSNAGLVFMLEDEGQLYQAEAGLIRATGPIEWSAPVTDDGPYRYLPLLAGDLILVKTGDNLVGRVYALDRLDGSIRWQINEPVVGNVATDFGVVYLLLQDGRLMGIEALTGRPVGVHYFTPGLQAQEPFTFSLGAYQDMVGVYLGDSRQLFVFRFAPPAS
jgi:outer membrane protein assembly factor BamB